MTLPRRDFVRALPVLTSGLVVGGSTLPLSACAGAPYLTSRPAPGGVAIPRESIPATGGAFVRVDGAERPVFVVRNSDGSFTALLASCTHQGCQPEPVGDRLVCPCHGSEFAFDGRVLEGPAERPLIRYAVLESGSDLVIAVGGVGL